MSNVSDNELAEIAAGCEGVTPGPWATGMAGDYPANASLNQDFTPIHSDTWGAFVSVVTSIENGGGRVGTTEQGAANLAHIARLDPATVLSLVTELQERRASDPVAGVGVLARAHAIERTSPKGEGQKFVGTCRLCGKTGLTTADLGEECPNVRGLTQDDALLEAVAPSSEGAALQAALDAYRPHAGKSDAQGLVAACRAYVAALRARSGSAVPDAVPFPQEMTPALKDVLSLMLWHSGELSRAWRLIGHEIPTRAEDEQAYVLHRLIPIAITHGEKWRAIVGEELRTAAQAKAALAAAPTVKGGV